jgi:hypothetical protein
MMKMRLFAPSALVLTLILAACTVQAAGPDDPPATGLAVTSPPDQPNPIAIEGLGVAIDVNPVLAAGVTQELIPAAGEDENTPYWAAHPEYLQVSFENYVREGTFHPAQVFVYPASAFEASNQAAAERISALRSMLQQRPPEVTGEVPFLPLFNAAQVIHAQFDYLTFEDGAGVRFVTQYGQGMGPINNNELFYTFQGLTDDGAYYVAAILPVSHPDLPADASVMPEGDWERYVSDVEQQLDVADPSSFQPDVAVLDQMIQTLAINDADS